MRIKIFHLKNNVNNVSASQYQKFHCDTPLNRNGLFKMEVGQVHSGKSIIFIRISLEWTQKGCSRSSFMKIGRVKFRFIFKKKKRVNNVDSWTWSA
jgi:hypothetical protein